MICRASVSAQLKEDETVAGDGKAKEKVEWIRQRRRWSWRGTPGKRRWSRSRKWGNREQQNEDEHDSNTTTSVRLGGEGVEDQE